MILHYFLKNSQYDREINCKNYRENITNINKYSHCSNGCANKWYAMIFRVDTYYGYHSTIKTKTKKPIESVIYFSICYERKPI